MTDEDARILEFAKRYYRHLGAREQALRDELGMSPTRFSQRLDRVIDDPDAYIAEPMLVKRLRRLREHRIKLRAG